MSIIDPIVLHSGWLRKQQAISRQWHSRYFVLYNDRLTHKHDEESLDSTLKVTFLLVDILNICRSIKVPNAIDIQLKDKSAVVILRAETSHELESWEEILNKQWLSNRIETNNEDDTNDNDSNNEKLLSKSGMLLKQSGNKYALVLQERYVVIDGHYLKYYKKKTDRICVGTVNLERADLARLYDLNLNCRTFEIHDDGRVYKFEAKDHNSCKEWVKAINYAIKVTLKNVETLKKQKVLNETPECIKLYDAEGVEAFIKFLNDDFITLYPMNVSAIQEHLECADAMVEYLFAFVPLVAKSSNQAARYDILAIVLSEINSLLTNRLLPLVVPDSTLLTDSNLGDIHSIITWISKYQYNILHIYCPTTVNSNNPKGSIKNSKITNIHGFSLVNYIPALCDRYVYGDKASKGALAHLTNHCSVVWSNVRSNPLQMMQQHKDGSFYTFAPTDIWEALNQHLSLAISSETKILYALMIEVIASALASVISEISEYVKAFNIEKSLTTYNLNNESEALEFLCAIANDNAKHIEEVVEIVKSFDDEELRRSVSETFDSVTKQLIICGELCLNKLTEIVMIDLKDHFEVLFTPTWLQSDRKVTINTILATIDDYLRDFQKFLMPYWAEKMSISLLNTLVVRYGRILLFRDSSKATAAPAAIQAVFAKSLANVKAFDSSLSSNISAPTVNTTPITSPNSSKLFSTSSKISSVLGISSSESRSDYTPPSTQQPSPSNSSKKQGFLFRRRNSKNKLSTTSPPSDTTDTPVANATMSSKALSAFTSLKYSKPGGNILDVDDELLEALTQDMQDICSFFEEKTYRNDPLIQPRINLLAEIILLLSIIPERIHDHIAELLIKYPLQVQGYLYIVIACLHHRRYKDDVVTKILLDIKSYYLQSLELTANETVRQEFHNNKQNYILGFLFNEVAMISDEKSLPIKQNIGGRLAKMFSLGGSSDSNSNDTKTPPSTNNTTLNTKRCGSSRLANDVAKLINGQTEELLAQAAQAELLQQQQEELLTTKTLHFEGFLEKQNDTHGIWQNRWFKLITRQNFITDKISGNEIVGSLTYILSWSKTQKGASLKSIELNSDEISTIYMTSSPRVICYNIDEYSLALQTENNQDCVIVKCSRDDSSNTATNDNYYSFTIDGKGKKYHLRSHVVDSVIKWIYYLAKATDLLYDPTLCRWVKANDNIYKLYNTIKSNKSDAVSSISNGLTGLSIQTKRRVLHNLKRNKLRKRSTTPRVIRVYGGKEAQRNNHNNNNNNNNNNTIKQPKLPNKFKGYNCKQYMMTLEKFNEYGQTYAEISWKDIEIMTELSPYNVTY